MGYRYPRTSRYTLKIKRGLSGFGVFAGGPIKRGAFVVEYCGKIVSDEEAHRVAGKYLFRLDGGKTILGNDKANRAKYINHACKPNCEAEMDGKRIFIYAKRAIQEGEELTYHYGKEYFDDHLGKNCRCPSCGGGK